MEQELVHTSKKTGNQSRFWQSDRQDRLKTSLSAYLKKKLGVFSTSELTIVFFLHSFFLPFKLEPFPAQCVVLHSFTSYSFPTSFLSFDNHSVGLAFTESRKQMVSLILWGEKKVILCLFLILGSTYSVLSIMPSDSESSSSLSSIGE